MHQVWHHCLSVCLNYCTFLHVAVPGSEAGGLAHGGLHTKELLLVRVLVRFGDWHRCGKAGLQDVLLAEKNHGLLVNALDLPRVQARRLQAMTTSDTERCHAVVPLHGKGHQVYLTHTLLFDCYRLLLCTMLTSDD